MPFSASCRPVFVLSNGVLTFVVCHVLDFCDFFKVGQIYIERVPLHDFLPVSRTPRHAYRCAASLAGFPLACQSCSILRSLCTTCIARIRMGMAGGNWGPGNAVLWKGSAKGA